MISRPRPNVIFVVSIGLLARSLPSTVYWVARVSSLMFNGSNTYWGSVLKILIFIKFEWKSVLLFSCLKLVMAQSEVWSTNAHASQVWHKDGLTQYEGWQQPCRVSRKWLRGWVLLLGCFAPNTFYVWVYKSLFEPMWSCSRLFEAAWAYVRLSEPIC